MPIMTITNMRNPITRSDVRLSPAYCPLSRGDLEIFMDKFSDWCAAQWEARDAATHRGDPLVVNPYEVRGDVFTDGMVHWGG